MAGLRRKLELDANLPLHIRTEPGVGYRLATGLPQDALEAGLQEHVMGLAMVVDAQAAEDSTAAYSHLRAAYLHMQALGDALSGAIAGQFPEMFPMEGTSEG